MTKKAEPQGGGRSVGGAALASIATKGGERMEEKELAAEVSDKPESKFENAVLGVNSKTFEATMLLMNDLTGHFRGERYTIVIEVEPEGVIVRKFPKE